LELHALPCESGVRMVFLSVFLVEPRFCRVLAYHGDCGMGT
jgi:hypothetical protein